MKKILSILMSILMFISTYTVNVYAETFSINSSGNLSESGWNDSYDSIVIGEDIDIMVDCFAVVNSLSIGKNSSVTIVPSDGEPNGFMIEGGSLTVGSSVNFFATHADGKSDGLLDLRGVSVTGLNLYRPTDSGDEQIMDNQINGVFSYNTQLDKWFINGEELGPTDEFPYVIHYSCGEGGSVQITNLTIEDENKLVDGKNTTVRLPNSVTSVVFTYAVEEGKCLDGIFVEQDGNDVASRFVDLENDARHNSTNKTFTIDLTQTKYNDSENTNYKFVNMDFSFRDEDGGGFGPNNENPYVISYQCEGNGSVSITNPDFIDGADVFVDDDSNTTSVRVANSQNTIEFTYAPEEGYVLDGIWIEQVDETINLETDGRLDRDNKTFTLDISSGDYNDAKSDISGAKFVFVKFSFASEKFGPNNENPYVISYQCEGNGSISITNPSFIDAVDTFVDADNSTTSIRVANSQNTIEFTYAPEEGYVLDKIWIKQGNETIDLETDNRLDEDNNTFTLDISSGKYNNPDIDGTKFVFVKFSFVENVNDHYEVSFPNDALINNNVISFPVKGNSKKVGVTVTGADVDSANRKVSIPKDSLSSVTFTVDYSDFGEYWDRYVRNIDLMIGNGQDRISLPLTNKTTSLATIPSDINLSDTLNLEVVYHEFPWYTVSFGNSGNVQTEHGRVIAERIHLGDKTYTNISEEVNETNKIHPMSEIIGGNSDVDSPQYVEDKDTLRKHKLAYGSGDIMIELGTEGVSIDYKFIPDYGYQVTDIVLNEHESILGDFNPDAEEISEFTFEAKRNSNVHFLVVFSKTEDKTNVTAANVNSATIENGQNAATSGNLSLTVEDTTKDSSITNSVSTLNVTLDNIVSKGGKNGDWTDNITEFDNPITINLTLDTVEYNQDDYAVVRDHNGTKEILQASYNPSTGELSFETNKFSAYTIITKTQYIMEEKQDEIDMKKGEDVLFSSQADFEKFVGVKIDGIMINATNYVAESGSTDITLKASYLRTLSNGNHTIEIVSLDGSAKASFKITGNPTPIPAPIPSSRYKVPNTGIR